MNLDVQFLFSNDLVNAVEKLIKNADKQLLLISPFIDLDPRIKDALMEKENDPHFELRVLFGKNEKDIRKSIKKDSLDLLKSFPNVDIRYESRLHAKFYVNDTHFIMTSMNLYDYSLSKNIEVGVQAKYNSKSLVGKVRDEAFTLIDSSFKDFLGTSDNESDPITEFENIFGRAQQMYLSKAYLKDKKRLNPFSNKKEIDRVIVDVDLFKESNIEKAINNSPKKDSDNSQKYLSVSKISKLYNVSPDAFIELMEEQGYIKDNVITRLGLDKGLVLKKYMGREYIAYPENLEYLQKIVN